MRHHATSLTLCACACGPVGLIDDAGPDCPIPEMVEVGIDDDSLGFSAVDVLVVANARGPATFTWADKNEAELELLFANAGLVQVSDPEFDPKYPSEEAQRFCEKLAQPAQMRIAVDGLMRTSDGGLDVSLPATLTALEDAGPPGFVVASFGSDVLVVDDLDGYTPPPEFQTDAYSEVVIEVYGWFDEARPIWIDEETSRGDGHGTIDGRGTKAPGASEEDTCPDQHGSSCDFFVGFWAFE